MTQRLLLSLFFLGLFVFLAATVPFMIPVVPLPDLVSAQELANEDSEFIELRGLQLHLKQAGTPASAEQPTAILLHGFASNTYTWRELMPTLADKGQVIAFDQVGFGLSSKPSRGKWQTWGGYNPYTLKQQVDTTVALMDALNVEKALLIGHSVGALIAVETALRYPDRVAGLVLIGAAVYQQGGAPTWLRPVLQLPQATHVGPIITRNFAKEPGEALFRSSWSDPDLVTEEMLAHYRIAIRTHNWDRALWEVTRTTAPRKFRAGELRQLTLPVLVVTGDKDQIVPPEQSRTLAEALPQAELAVLEGCAHAAHEECPQAFAAVLEPWLAHITPDTDTAGKTTDETTDEADEP